MHFIFSHLKSEPSDLMVILATDSHDGCFCFSNFVPFLGGEGAPWATMERMRAIYVLDWDQGLLPIKKPPGCAHPVYTSFNFVKEEEIGSVSYFLKQKVLLISPKASAAF